jgi:hypothetical protein
MSRREMDDEGLPWGSQKRKSDKYAKNREEMMDILVDDIDRYEQLMFIKCDIMTELNISNIATASETFTKPVQPVLKHQLFVSVNVIDENVHHFLSVFSVF